MMSRIVVWDCSVVVASPGSTATNTSIASVVISVSSMGNMVVVSLSTLMEVAVLSGLLEVDGRVVISTST